MRPRPRGQLPANILAPCRRGPLEDEGLQGTLDHVAREVDCIEGGSIHEEELRRNESLICRSPKRFGTAVELGLADLLEPGFLRHAFTDSLPDPRDRSMRHREYHKTP